MPDFVALITQGGILTAVGIWLYFERQRADKLQAERDQLLERTLKAMYDTAAALHTLERTLNTVMVALGTKKEDLFSGKDRPE